MHKTKLNPFKKITWVTGADGIKYPTSQITPSATEADIRKTWEYTNPASFIAGLGKETCRDIGHNYMGFGGIANVAETARIQGIDLYSEQKDRIIAAYELNAGYSNELLDEMDSRGLSYDMNTPNVAVPNLDGIQRIIGAVQTLILVEEVSCLGKKLPIITMLIDRVLRCLRQNDWLSVQMLGRLEREITWSGRR